MRGEQLLLGHVGPSSRGSPPRARGTVTVEASWRRTTGITPACAGNSRSDCGVPRSRWDHPRVRGEQAGYVGAVYVPKGSPPRARGTADFPVPDHVFDGITPACAGNRPSTTPRTARRWDHPRVRGEQEVRVVVEVVAVGSPPRARGTGAVRVPRAGWPGITPACAGNRSSARGRHRPTRDHPRVRGEQAMTVCSVPRCPGSPPRARGTDERGGVGDGALGITPACAGNRLLDLDR